MTTPAMSARSETSGRSPAKRRISSATTAERGEDEQRMVDDAVAERTLGAIHAEHHAAERHSAEPPRQGAQSRLGRPRLCGWRRSGGRRERLAQNSRAQLQPDRAWSALSPRHLFLDRKRRSLSFVSIALQQRAAGQAVPRLGWWRKLSPPLARAIGTAQPLPCPGRCGEPSPRAGIPRKVDAARGSTMSNFDADDVKVYKGWLRRTLAVYAGMLAVGESRRSRPSPSPRGRIRRAFSPPR